MRKRKIFISCLFISIFVDLNFHQTFLHSEEISISTRKYFSSLCYAEDEESEMEERIKPEEKQEKLSQERREGQRGKYQKQ